MKYKFAFVFAIALVLLLSACGANTSNEFDVAVSVSLTQTADTPATVQPSETAIEAENIQEAPATINGTVHLASPPTPSMIVYALDPETGEWATMQTDATDGEAPFELSVSPGTYIIFAFAADDSAAYAGFPSGDELDLGTIEVAAGQIFEDISVRPPSQADCGLLWGVPPSPDGRFAGFMASDACLNMNWAGGDYVVPSADLCQMLEGVAQETLNVPFELDMMDSFSDNITGESGSGCTMMAQVTGNQLSTQNGVIKDLMNAFIGWEEDPMYMADGPMGSATALRRDMALMILSSSWKPVEGIACPDDQPIAACELTAEQKLYTIKIQIGMK